MLSKNKIKFIQSLTRKKNRDELGLFLAEGDKLIQQLQNSGFRLHTLITTNEHIEKLKSIPCEIITASYPEIKKLSLLKSPQKVIAVCYQKKNEVNPETLTNELTLALDDVQDPGNLGTIIRLASWFGIKNIICSSHTVDCYNPKVIQSTMGAIAQVNVHYTKLEDFLKASKLNGLFVYGTFLEGENIYSTPLKQTGIIVLGNEGKGISTAIEQIIDQKILIPTFAEDSKNVESLNVSMATSIVCSEFKRRTI